MKQIGICVLVVGLMACGTPPQESMSAGSAGDLTIVPDVTERLEQFVPTDLTVDVESIGELDRKVLVELLAAAEIMDEIFLVQVSVDNPEMWEALEASTHPLIGPALD